MRPFLFIILLFVLFIGFQNCSPIGELTENESLFSSNNENNDLYRQPSTVQVQGDKKDPVVNIIDDIKVVPTQSKNFGTYPINVLDPKNFHPGHWIKTADPSDAYMTSLMKKIENSNIRGIEIWFRWNKLEPGAAGDYSGEYWDKLDKWMKQADEHGLAIFIRIRTHMFSAGRAPFTPDYMRKDSKYGGSPGLHGSYCSTSKCTLRPAWHNKNTVMRAKKLIDEFNRRWGRRKNFEGVGTQESAPGSYSKKTPNWDAKAHADGIIAIAKHIKSVMPTKTAIPNINWHPHMTYLLDELASAGIGLGCPDLPPDGSPPDKSVSDQMFSRHFNEDHSPGVSGGIGNTTGTLGNGWTLQQVYNNAINNLNIWRLTWDDDWLTVGLLDFVNKNEIPAAKTFYNSKE